MVILTPGTWYVGLQSAGFGGQRWAFIPPEQVPAFLANLPPAPTAAPPQESV